MPTVDDTVRSLALDQLAALLRLREVPFTRDVSPPTAPTLTVPMIVGEGPSANWIDVHHPLVDAGSTSVVVETADALERISAESGATTGMSNLGALLRAKLDGQRDER